MLTAIQLLLLIIGCAELRVVAGKHLIRTGLKSYPIPPGNSKFGKDKSLRLDAESQHLQSNTIGQNQLSSLFKHGYSGKDKSQVEDNKKKRHLWSPKERNDHRLLNRCQKTRRWKMKTDEGKESRKASRCHCSHQSKSVGHRFSKTKSSASGFQPAKMKGASFKFQRGMSAGNNYKTGDSKGHSVYRGGNIQDKPMSLPFAVYSYPPPLVPVNSLYTNVKPYYGQLSDTAHFRNGINQVRTGSLENIPRAPFLNLIGATQTPATHGEGELPGLKVNFNKPLGRGSGGFENWMHSSLLEKTGPEYSQCCPVGRQCEDVSYDSDRRNSYNMKAGNGYEIIPRNEPNDYDRDSPEASPDDFTFRSAKRFSSQSKALESIGDDDDDDDDDVFQQMPESSCSDNVDHYDIDYHDHVSAVSQDDKPMSPDSEGYNYDLYINTNDASLPQSDPHQECCDTDAETSEDADPNFSQWRPSPEAECASFPDKASGKQEDDYWSDDNSQSPSELASQTQKPLDDGGSPNFLDGITENVMPASKNAEIFPGVFAGVNSDRTIDTAYTDLPKQNFKIRRRKNLGHLLSDFMKKTKHARSQNGTTPETVEEFTTSPLVILETTENMLFSEMKEELRAMQATRSSKTQSKNKGRFRFLKEKTSNALSQ